MAIALHWRHQLNQSIGPTAIRTTVSRSSAPRSLDSLVHNLSFPLPFPLLHALSQVKSQAKSTKQASCSGPVFQSPPEEIIAGIGRVSSAPQLKSLIRRWIQTPPRSNLMSIRVPWSLHRRQVTRALQLIQLPFLLPLSLFRPRYLSLETLSHLDHHLHPHTLTFSNTNHCQRPPRVPSPSTLALRLSTSYPTLSLPPQTIPRPVTP